MIGIVDYGLGNIAAFETIYKRLNIPACVVATPEELAHATRLILPGVGAFDWAMRRLNDSGMREALDRHVRVAGVPVLGICVGMQMMTERSEEGVLDGLGWVQGEVRRFRRGQGSGPLQLPHMGWNDVQPARGEPLFRGLEEAARFYFLHSYYVVLSDSAHASAQTLYGQPFACSVRAGNVLGVQFHPEKSHAWGVQLLRNFAEVQVC